MNEIWADLELQLKGFSVIAKGHGEDLLAYLLAMAALEVERIRRQ